MLRHSTPDRFIPLHAKRLDQSQIFPTKPVASSPLTSVRPRFQHHSLPLCREYFNESTKGISLSGKYGKKKKQNDFIFFLKPVNKS